MGCGSSATIATDRILEIKSHRIRLWRSNHIGFDSSPEITLGVNPELNSSIKSFVCDPKFEIAGVQQNTPGQDRTGDLQRVRLTS